jgi:MYXO-CTERM domain-containing protein
MKKWLLLAALPLVFWSPRAHAANKLTIVDVKLDRPTIHTLGVQVLTSDDDNLNATITVRYRKKGDLAYRAAPKLFRVLPDSVVMHTVPNQFAGSIFDLAPGTTYEIEILAKDPDAPDEVKTLEGTTRAYPVDPKVKNTVTVNSKGGLDVALSNAKAGDVIELEPGLYTGTATLNASGTPENPIVIRGQTTGAILDGAGCDACNALEIYGSNVHVERLTIQKAQRAIRFFGATTGNSVRYAVIKDVVHGIGSSAEAKTDFTICDNDIQGRLVWPWPFQPNATDHWDDQGISVNGAGHVVCHNRIKGFGDPVINKIRGVRAWDVHGNDISDAQDGTELDESEGNARLFRNRFVNVMAPISIQPSLGGPLYALRNVIINCGDEPIKLKSLGGTDEPSGVLIHHNTFVSSRMALNLQTPITQHNFDISNNLFVGPKTLVGTRTVEWTAEIDRGRFDRNGYFPNGGFWLGTVSGTDRIYSDFTAMQAAGVVEKDGRLLTEPIFSSGVVGLADPQASGTPVSVALANGSNAIDAAEPIDGINGGWYGKAPDLGAHESGCPEPKYGPRAEGNNEISAIQCLLAPDNPDAGVGQDGGPTSSSSSSGATPTPTDSTGPAPEDDGCGCRTEGGAPIGRFAPAPALGLVAIVAALVRRRRRRSEAARP